MTPKEELILNVRRSELVMLPVAAVCIELLFGLLAIVVPFLSTEEIYRVIAWVLIGLLACATPFATVAEWKREWRKPLLVMVPLERLDPPQTIKTLSLGWVLLLKAESLQSVSKQNFENIEIPYRNVTSLEFTSKSAFVMRVRSKGRRLPLEINLSLIDKKQWPFIVDTIAANAPEIELDALAADIRDGKVPG